MGKTRETANITSENLVSTNITSDFLNVGTAITMYGGSAGIVSATSFYGDGSNLTGLTGTSVAVTLDSTTGSAYKIPYLNTTSNSSGNYELLLESGTFTYQPSNNTLTVNDISVSTIYVSTGIRLSDSDYIYYGSSNDAKVFYDGTANDLEIELEASANKIAITDNGTYKHLITRDGKVGINTSVTPTVELDVSGNVNISGVVTATSFYAESGTYDAGIDTKTDAAIVIEEEGTIYTKDGDRLRVLIEKKSDVINIGQQNTAFTDGIELKPGASGGQVKLHAGGSSDNVKLETTGSGVTITGVCTATSFSGSGSSLTGLTGASAATYGDASNVAQIVVDANGRITSISNVAVSGGGGGGISDIVEDTTPQLGGNLDVNGKNINLGDSGSASDDRLNFGAGTDLSIYFDGTNSYIDVNPDAANHLYIRNNVGSDYNGDIRIQAKSGENSIICYDDSSVELFHDNSSKLTTTSTGFTVTGTGLGNWKVNDNSYLTAGTGDDFQIYHNGSHTYLDNDTGHLYIRNNVGGDVGGDIRLMPHDNENGIIIYDDSSVELFYDNSSKLTTTSTGFTVTGTGLGNWKANDNSTLTAGTGDDFQIYHNGSHTYLDNDTGHLYIRNNVGGDVGGDIRLMPHDNENGIIIYDDSGVELYHDNSVKLTTTSTGVSVTGTLSTDEFSFADNKTITFGTSSDLSIYHGVTNNIGHSYIDNNTGHLYIRNNVAGDVGGDIRLMPHDNENGIIIYDDSGVELYCDNAVKLTTTSTGFTVTGTGLGNFKSNDNSTLTAGTGDDFQIYHNGSHTYLDNDTGHLYIRNNVAGDVGGDIRLMPHDNENGIIIYDDSGVELFYDNSSKLTTTSTGFTVTGTGLGNFKANDNSTITAGTGDDFQIYHDGSSTYLDNDTGNLFIRTNVASDVGGNIYLRPHDNENGIIITHDGPVQLYHDNALKLTTSSTGITITGTGVGDGWKVNDSEYFTAGTGDDFQIYHNGSHTYLDNDTGHLYIRNNVASDVNGDIYIQAKSGENGIVIQDDGEVQLYYDNAEKLNTSSTGVTVTGALTATTIVKSGGTSSEFLKADGSVDTSTYLQNLSEDTTPQLGGTLDTNGNLIEFGDSASATDDRLHFGADDDLEIYHNGSNSRICDRGTGNLQLISNSNIVFLHQDDESDAGSTIAKFLSDGANELYYNATKKFETTNSGAIISGIATASNIVSVKSDDGTSGRIDLYCESANAHYARIQAPAHADFSGNVTITLPNSTGTLLNSDGSGANLTALNASNLGSGTVPDARFPATLPAVSGASLTGLTGVSHGTYGDASNVAQIAVDTNGRITSITEVAISGGGGGGASEAFKTISVSGQSDVVADSATDTLTLVAGSNMTITTNASGDSITFASTGGGGGGSGITRAQSMISAMVFS